MLFRIDKIINLPGIFKTIIVEITGEAFSRGNIVFSRIRIVRVSRVRFHWCPPTRNGISTVRNGILSFRNEIHFVRRVVISRLPNERSWINRMFGNTYLLYDTRGFNNTWLQVETVFNVFMRIRVIRIGSKGNCFFSLLYFFFFFL